MKPEKSPKLKGSWLREINRIQSICRKIFDMDQLIEKISNYREKPKLVEIADKTFFHCDSSPFNMIHSDLFSINFVDHTRIPIVGFRNLPSTVIMNTAGAVWGYKYERFRNAHEGFWGSPELHRENGPARVLIKSVRNKRVIQLVEFAEQGITHSLCGPAQISFSDSPNYSLNYKWFFFGKEYPLYEVRKWVEKPFNISKQEQIYLKLMLAPST